MKQISGVLALMAIGIIAASVGWTEAGKCNKCIPYVEVLYQMSTPTEYIQAEIRDCHARGCLISGNMAEVYVRNGAQGHAVERRLRSDKKYVQFAKLIHRRAVLIKNGDGRIIGVQWDWHDPEKVDPPEAPDIWN